MTSRIAAALFAFSSATLSSAQMPLKHAGENCFYHCWKQPGFCNWCGQGNACCKQGDGDADPKECYGPLVYKAAGQYHECVKAAFLPGQAPPAKLVSPGTVTTLAKEQCISYMAENGCGWTSRYSCPGQPKGYAGVKAADSSIGYKCCCTNGMWKDSAVKADTSAATKAVTTDKKCHDYMNKNGCGWSKQYSCPGQAAGTSGKAHDDGSTGYQCCCKKNLWKVTVPVVTAASGVIGSTTINPNAFDVNAVMQELPSKAVLLSVPVPAGTKKLPVPDVTGFVAGRQVTVAKGTPEQEQNTISGFEQNTILLRTPLNTAHAAGSEIFMPSFVGTEAALAGSGVSITPGTAPTSQEALLANHKGPNVHVQEVRLTDPSFIPTAHHGPINNKFSANTAESRGERCQYGICADLEGNDPDASPATVAGVPVKGEQVMDSIVAAVDGNNQITTSLVPSGPAPAPVGVLVSPAPTPAMVDSLVKTTLSAPVLKGATSLPVGDQSQFKVGDSIKIGGIEIKKITGFGTIVIDSPLQNSYPAGTEVVKQDQIAARVIEPETAAAGAGSSLPLWGTLLLVLGLCCCIAAGAAAVLMMKKKKGRGKTDREEQMKEDFIERQPVYHEVPEAEPLNNGTPDIATVAVDYNHDGRVDAIIQGVDRDHDGIPDVVQRDGYLAHHTPNALGGQEVARPDILRQVAPVPTRVSYPAQPQSMYQAAPYGNYAASPSYYAAPAVYTQYR